MRKKSVKQAAALFMAMALIFTSVGLQSITAKAEQTETVQENILKLDMDENGYLTPTEESQEMLTKLESESLENQKFSWDNATVYFVLTDRFLNSDKSNDHSYGRGLQADGKTPVEGLDTYTNPGTFHGGDLGGLTQKVNEGYFTDLGVNAIWITAPYEQIHGYTSGNVKSNKANTYPDPDKQGFPYYSYHGYWTLDYTNIDENMGDEEKFEEFVDSCHSKGIRVVMDVVMNHVGYTTMQDAVDYGFDGALKGDWQTYYYGNATYLMGGDPECSNYWDLNSSAWAKWWGPGFVRASYPGYDKAGGDDFHMSLCGLPDVVTESSAKEVPTPPLLVTKWTKEGRLAQEQKELDDFFSKTGYKKLPRYYIIKWLTDWVREYGVDGFRCDTAKHVDKDAWNDLKTEADKALKEWRANNPDKPGAKWTDDFWMTGEEWNHGMGKSAYFTNGFDSMINFKFNKSGNPSGMEGTYKEYAAAINSDPNFNALSYISSHDDGENVPNDVWKATDEHNMDLGTCLLLSPGGVQIYYGNEVNRGLGWTDFFTGNDYLDQRYRTDMDWDHIKTEVLAHWQQVGQFRNKHIAVGAGQHQKLEGDVYTFSRTYHLEEEDEDKVVVALPGKDGTFDISVGDVFEDGETITDYYSGEKYEVSGGKVSVTCDKHGVILLEGSGIVKPSVGAKAKGGDGYRTDTLSVTLKANRVKDTYYTIIDQTNPKGIKKSYTADQVIEIGGAAAYDEETKLVLEGKSEEDGSTVTKEVTFKRSSEPNISDGVFCVKVSKKQFPEPPNIFLYTNDAAETALDGAWPGPVMTQDDDSNYWSYKNEEINGEALIIVSLGATSSSGGTWRTTPDKAKGLLAQGCMLLDKESKTLSELPSGEPGRVDIKYVDDSGKVLKEIYRVGVEGKPYNTYPAEIDGYTLKTTPSNAKGTFAASGTVEYVYSSGVTPPPDDKEITIAIADEAFTYDGTAKKPKVIVKEGSTELKEDTDYEVSYTNNVDAGNAEAASGAPTVSVSGKGTYANNEKLNKTFKFTIQPKAINTEGITVSDVTECIYTGKELTPSVKVTDNGTTIASSNYELIYSDNIHAGTAKITIKGKGNYTGELNKEFTIEQAEVPSNKPSARIVADKNKNTLSQVSLPEGWQWKDGSTALELGEEIQASAEYCGDDKDDYKTTSVMVTVVKTDCNHSETKKEDKAATCVEPGYTGREICTKCGMELDEGTIVPATGQHTGGTATCTKKKKCIVCNQEYGEVDSSKHTGGTATCVKGKICTECGQEYGEKDSSNHVGGTRTKGAVAATCVAEGYSGDVCCELCGTTITPGHKIEALGHNWDNGRITLPPTATTEGVKTYICERCKDTKTEVIPATGDQKPGDPGDTKPGDQNPGDTKPGNQNPGGSTSDNKQSGNQTTGGQTSGNQTPGTQTPEDSLKQKTVYVTTSENRIESGDTIIDSSAKTTYRVINDGIADKEVEYVVSRTKAEEVVIPDEVVINGKNYKVTTVADGAFKNNRNVKAVEIGKNVETIEENAFSGCKNLDEVVVSGNVTAIKDKAFYKCNSLTSITIPAKVGKIGKQAFYGCKKLKKITIQSTKLTNSKVGSKAFKGVPANATIKVPKSKLNAYKKLFKAKGLNSKVKIRK